MLGRSDLSDHARWWLVCVLDVTWIGRSDVNHRAAVYLPKLMVAVITHTRDEGPRVASKRRFGANTLPVQAFALAMWAAFADDFRNDKSNGNANNKNALNKDTNNKRHDHERSQQQSPQT